MVSTTTRVEVLQFANKKGVELMECDKSNLHLWGVVL
jgi:hypothetical protein